MYSPRLSVLELHSIAEPTAICRVVVELASVLASTTSLFRGTGPSRELSPLPSSVPSAPCQALALVLGCVSIPVRFFSYVKAAPLEIVLRPFEMFGAFLRERVVVVIGRVATSISSVLRFI